MNIAQARGLAWHFAESINPGFNITSTIQPQSISCRQHNATSTVMRPLPGSTESLLHPLEQIIRYGKLATKAPVTSADAFCSASAAVCASFRNSTLLYIAA